MFHVFIAVVLLSPLPFGAVMPWAWSVLGLTTSLLIAGWIVERIITGTPPAIPLARIMPIATPFAGAILWAVFQALPFAPESWIHPLWADSSRALNQDLPGSISVNPGETWAAISRLLTYAGIFWLALQYARDRRRARTMLMGFTVAGLLYATYGLAIQFSGDNMVLWVPKKAYLDSVTSTFINRNSYATYAGIALIAATGLLADREGKGHTGRPVAAEQIRRMLIFVTGRSSVLVVAWIATATALFLTNSRGGLISAVIGLAALVGAMASSRRSFSTRPLVLAIGATVALTVVFLLSGDIVSQRLATTDIELENRPKAYSLTLAAAHEAGWSGTGLGSFADIFRIYRDESIPGIYDKAHNTFLELLLELGPIATALLLTSVLAALLLCGIGIRSRQQDNIYPAVTLAASVLVGVHAMVDFSLQIPAIAASYAMILGIGCAQSWSSRMRMHTT